jgi:hypothetical protein
MKNIYSLVKNIYINTLPEPVKKILWPVKHFTMFLIPYLCIYIYEMTVCMFNKNAVRVSFINFWPDVNCGWFLSPLSSCSNGHDKPYMVVKYFKPDIQFFSVFGSIDPLVNSKITHKIFFTGENVGATSICDSYKQYKDNCIDYVSLSLGFDYMNNSNYLRFPLWLLRFFSPVDTKESIQKKLSEFAVRYEKTKFCALVSSYDDGLNIRMKIFNFMSKIGRVDCSGAFLHNDDTLREKFDNNKSLYLRQYYFNICPENSVSKGYVTEKLFDALYSGCIPVYFGGGGDPEPGIIDPGCFLWFEPDSDNDALFAEVQKLYTNKAYFESFKRRRIFLDTAVDKIYYTLQHYNARIREIAHSAALD